MNRLDETGNPVPNPESQEIRFTEDHSWTKETNEFYNAIASGAPIKAGTSQQALEVMQLVGSIYAADPEWKAVQKQNVLKTAG